MSETLKLRFGAMAPLLKDQLKEQKFSVCEEEIKHFQKDADALIRLKVRGIIPAGEVEKATKRLIKKIREHIESRLQPSDFK
jgi:hypothetical protein